MANSMNLSSTCLPCPKCSVGTYMARLVVFFISVQFVLRVRPGLVTIVCITLQTIYPR
jgi:hypothetical protein